MLDYVSNCCSTTRTPSIAALIVLLVLDASLVSVIGVTCFGELVRCDDTITNSDPEMVIC